MQALRIDNTCRASQASEQRSARTAHESAITAEVACSASLLHQSHSHGHTAQSPIFINAMSFSGADMVQEPIHDNRGWLMYLLCQSQHLMAGLGITEQLLAASSLVRRHVSSRVGSTPPVLLTPCTNHEFL